MAIVWKELGGVNPENILVTSYRKGFTSNSTTMNLSNTYTVSKKSVIFLEIDLVGNNGISSYHSATVNKNGENVTLNEFTDNDSYKVSYYATVECNEGDKISFSVTGSGPSTWKGNSVTIVEIGA